MLISVSRGELRRKIRINSAAKTMHRSRSRIFSKSNLNLMRLAVNIYIAPARASRFMKSGVYSNLSYLPGIFFYLNTDYFIISSEILSEWKIIIMIKIKTIIWIMLFA